MKTIYQKIKQKLKAPQPDKPEVKFQEIDKAIRKIKEFQIIQQPKYESGGI